MEISTIEKALRPDYFRKQMNKQYNYCSINYLTLNELFHQIDDDYLSEWEVFKFKNMYWKQTFLKGYLALFGTTFVFHYFITHRLLGVEKKKAYNRYNIFFISFLCGLIATKELAMRNSQNKDFHEIITQPEPRGKFIRSTLKNSYPRNWAMISKDLHDLGYNFKEMNEYSNKEEMVLPTNKFDNKLH